jgi:uncharacterized protein YutE (UPF0331/DUF86 family)
MIYRYKKLLSDLITDFDSIRIRESSVFVAPDSVSKCQILFSRSVNLIENITSGDSYYYREAERIISGSKRQGGIHKSEIQMIIGHLKALLEDLENGLLSNIEYRISAKSFLDFFDHAKAYLKQNKKMEASVIASSVFEDTIRKIGRKNCLEFPKLDRLIDELKKSEIITATEMKKYKYFAGIRNEAMHANWDKISLDDVEDLIRGVEKSIDKYLDN